MLGQTREMKSAIKINPATTTGSPTTKKKIPAPVRSEESSLELNVMYLANAAAIKIKKARPITKSMFETYRSNATAANVKCGDG